MEESIEIYIWVYKGKEIQKKIGEPGHAAMLIPWYSGAPVERKYPLYISLHNTSMFFSKQNDISHWPRENYQLHRFRLPCTEEQAAKIWQSLLLMKNPEYADKANFEREIDSYMPYCEIDPAKSIGQKFFYKNIYNTSFYLFANREDNDDVYNCTTFIFKLLNDAGISLPHYRGSNKIRGVVVGLLQLLSSAAVGYNIGVAIEACEVCLPDETKHIWGSAIASLVIMSLALMMETCCLPFVCAGDNGISKKAKDLAYRCKLPPSTFNHLPWLMFGVNLIILIYVAVIHGKYHALFGNASIIGPLAGGLVVGTLFCLFSMVRSCYTDVQVCVTKPQALQELLEQKEEANSQVVELEETEEEGVHRQSNQWLTFLGRESPAKSLSINSSSDERLTLDEETEDEDSTDYLLARV